MTPTSEAWRPVVEYEGLYEVSDQGRVRSPRTILRPYVDDVGRHSVGLFRQGKCSTQRISVLVLAAFVGPRPEGFHGCHNDGNPGNNRLGNLRWDTPSANVRDAIRHGTNSELRKTHCPRGHLLADPNLSSSHARHGRRVCLACHRALCARRRAELRNQPFDMQRVSDEYHEAIMRAA